MNVIFLLRKMDGRRVFSILLTFLLSLDLGDILMILPQNLINNLSSNSHCDYRTIKSSSDNNINSNVRNFRLLPFVGALVTEEQLHFPGFLSSSKLASDSGLLASNKFDEGASDVNDKLLYRLTDSSLLSQRNFDLSFDSSVENNAEEEEEAEEESVSISRTVEPQVLQRLESKFLKLFGMNKRPAKKHAKDIKVPKYLLDLYARQSGNDLATSNLNLPGRNTRTANTVRTFYLEPGSSLPVTKGHKNHLKFNLNSIPSSEEVTGAELRVPFQLHRNPESELLSELKSVKILLHDIIKPVTPPNSKKPKESHLKEPITYPIDSKSVDLSKRRNGTSTFWLTFDVFPAVSRWIAAAAAATEQGKKNKANHGLLLEIIGLTNNGQFLSHDEIHHGHTLRVKREILDDSSHSLGKTKSSESKTKPKTSWSSASNPDGKGTEVGAVEPVIQQNEKSSTPSSLAVLFTYSDDGRNGRKVRDAKTLSRHYRAAQNQKRRKNHRNKNRKRNLCARHNMFVDFTDVGWNDWIVAPPGYHAYHCSGECPFPMAEHLNATNHAVIQALVNSMNPGLVPPPCCVPTKYSSLSLLYTDSSDKIVLKNYNEMVVDSCGCS